MVTTKHCAFGKCNSDSRYADKPYMKGVFFVRFPGPKRKREQCRKWVAACRRENFSIENVSKDSYICSKHFIGGNGPTELSPDPVPATATLSKTKVCRKPPRKRQRTSKDYESIEQNFAVEGVENRDTCIENNDRDCVVEASSNDILAAESLLLLSTTPFRSVPTESRDFSWFSKSLTEISKFLEEREWAIQFSKLKLTFLKVNKSAVLAKVVVSCDKEYKVYILERQVMLPSFPELVSSMEELCKLIETLDKWNICSGNSRKEYINIFHEIQSKSAHLCPVMSSIRSDKSQVLSSGKKFVVSSFLSLYPMYPFFLFCLPTMLTFSFFLGAWLAMSLLAAGVRDGLLEWWNAVIGEGERRQKERKVEHEKRERRVGF